MSYFLFSASGDDEDDEDKDKASGNEPSADKNSGEADDTSIEKDSSDVEADNTELSVGSNEDIGNKEMQIDNKMEQESPEHKVSEGELRATIDDPDLDKTERKIKLSDNLNDYKHEMKQNGEDSVKDEGEKNDIVECINGIKKEPKEDNESTPSVEAEKHRGSDKTSNGIGLNVKKRMSDAEIEREVKRELKEAVEIRIPKIRSKRDSDDMKWMSPESLDKSGKSGKRPDTPPLQRLMRHEFSPLKKDSSAMHSSSKRLKDSSHTSSKEGFTSKLASVIIPSSNISISPKTASHPKQILSHSLGNIGSSSFSSRNPYSASSLLNRAFPSSQQLFQNFPSSSDNEQPLDLSKKSGKGSPMKSRDRSSSSASKSDFQNHENSSSSASLQSLQQKFGGDFHLRGLRKPLNYMLYGPEIPALHQALLHTASMALPHFPFPLTNGLPKYTPEKSRHRSSTPSPSSKSKLEDSSKPVKKEEHTPNEKSMKRESAEKTDVENGTVDEKQGENYTNHLCTCGKWFDGLYSLSLHLQETGHLPARNKSVSLMEYPKLVRGQDMWLNQESEQTRRILRCIQCGESFKTLPLLTVHMMKTQHYTKIVSSEHARRAHKCSAYCDKEQDKDCVFKCKVCQDTFPDMEGLANHMIMSGHHKKQSPRLSQSFSDVQFKKRKRYSFEEALHPFGNPSMAAMLELKRQSMGGHVSPDLSVDDLDDSKITCENCGNRIETKVFVEHVRACLGQRLREDVARLEKEKENLKKLERERKRLLNLSEKEHSEVDQLKSPLKKKKLDSSDSSSEDTNIEKSKSSEEQDEIEKYIKMEVDDVLDKTDTHMKLETPNSNVAAAVNASQSSQSNKNEIVEEIEAGEITDKSKNILKEIQTLVDSKSPSFEIKHEIDKIQDVGNPECKKSKHSIAKKLEIIDPDNVKEDSSAQGSALSAMESFIKKSFSNKFDYKKGNIVISPHSSADATVHTGTLGASSLGFETIDYLNRYKNFYAALNLNNGFKQDSFKGKMKAGDSSEKLKNGIKSESDSDDNHKLFTGKLNSDDEREEGRVSVMSDKSDTSGVLEKGASLETKYLNMEEGDEGKSTKGDKSSALDNLSSFVYGQTLTSEHPLDSLQKLITKSDIPKLMASDTGGRLKYLPPHLQMHHAHLDLTVPLNLSVKSPKGDSDEEDERSRHDDDSLSDYDPVNSPSNSDGEPVDYRCAACNRRFASKGSYRYHLSRCHLSSVKKYGIKEAFNMSPYVYLPLDHTAKFSKYYEMAKELANKAKENRAKSN